MHINLKQQELKPLYLQSSVKLKQTDYHGNRNFNYLEACVQILFNFRRHFAFDHLIESACCNLSKISNTNSRKNVKHVSVKVFCRLCFEALNYLPIPKNSRKIKFLRHFVCFIFKFYALG